MREEHRRRLRRVPKLADALAVDVAISAVNDHEMQLEYMLTVDDLDSSHRRPPCR